jgi:hypothetical protein
MKTSYYVVFTVVEGVNGSAYIINDRDNNIDDHLVYSGDVYKFYEIYNTKAEAVKVVNAFNQSINGGK